MGIVFTPFTADDLDYHVYLGLLNPNGPFPKKIYAHGISMNDPPLIYVPRQTAHALIFLDDDDYAIGRCKCSCCHETIDIFDKYCSHCGSKIIDRKTIGEGYDKSGSIHI